MFDSTFKIALLIIIGILLLAKILWILRGMRRRRCPCGSIFVVREYLMIQVFGRTFSTQTSLRCLRCPLVRIAKEPCEKTFSWSALIWRKVRYKKQFKTNRTSPRRSYSETTRLSNACRYGLSLLESRRGPKIPLVHLDGNARVPRLEKPHLPRS